MNSEFKRGIVEYFKGEYGEDRIEILFKRIEESMGSHNWQERRLYHKVYLCLLGRLETKIPTSEVNLLTMLTIERAFFIVGPLILFDSELKLSLFFFVRDVVRLQLNNDFSKFKIDYYKLQEDS